MAQFSSTQNSSIVDETDPTLPFSTLLRQGTQKSHSRIHRNRRVQLLADGLLDKEEYLKLLFMLWHVYDTLESCLNTHQSHPQISPWYNPTLHPRKHQISLDISYYLSTEPNSWRALPLFKSYNPSALNEYTTHLLTLSQTRPELLLAHGYTRYLGDLSGGQTIKRSIIKAYGEGVDRKGVKFYDFGTEDEEELKAMKQNFRDGIDRAVGEDTTLKAALIKEANKAFQLNEGLFNALRPLSNRSRSQPLAVEKPERSIQLSTLISVILAACITHFVLVVGGFTGASGSAKLVGFFGYLKRFGDGEAIRVG